MLEHAATRTGDDLLLAMATYVRREVFFANGDLISGASPDLSWGWWPGLEL